MVREPEKERNVCLRPKNMLGKVSLAKTVMAKVYLQIMVLYMKLYVYAL